MAQWFYEEQEKGVSIGFEYSEQLVDDKSIFQKVDIFQTKGFGKLLTLDGLVMTTDRDEFFYHEMLTHPALFTHPNPKRVLVIGGGDGGTLREVVKQERVEEGHLCEIDKMVCDVCEEHFPELSKSFKDPKSTVYIEDGFKFLDEHKGYYDVILVDSTDPIGEAAKLFEDTFIGKVVNALIDDGIMVMQCENGLYQLPVMKKMHDLLGNYFPEVHFYFSPVPTYPSGNWAFLMGSKKYHPLKDFQKEAWDKHEFKTRYYNQEIHNGAFALPQYIKEGLK